MRSNYVFLLLTAIVCGCSKESAKELSLQADKNQIELKAGQSAELKIDIQGGNLPCDLQISLEDAEKAMLVPAIHLIPTNPVLPQGSNSGQLTIKADNLTTKANYPVQIHGKLLCNEQKELVSQVINISIVPLAANTEVLDKSFAQNGKFISEFSESEERFIRNTAITPDNKIIAVGELVEIKDNVKNTDFLTMIFDQNGKLLREITADALVDKNKKGTYESAADVAIVPISDKNYRIYVGGGADPQGSSSDFAVICYDSATDFAPCQDVGGKNSNPVGAFTNGEFSVGATNEVEIINSLRYVKLGDDFKLVAGGSALDHTVGYYYFAVARYNLDGSLDTSFAPSSSVPGTKVIGSLADPNDPDQTAEGISLSVVKHNSGYRYILAGTNELLYRELLDSPFPPEHKDLAFVCFEDNGELCQGFGGKNKSPQGVVIFNKIFDNKDLSEELTASILLNDQKIYFSGFTKEKLEATTNSRFMVGCLNVDDGSLCQEFGGKNGDTIGFSTKNKVFAGLEDTSQYAMDLAIVPKGSDFSLLVTGYTYNLQAFANDLAILSYNKAGQLDRSFAKEGRFVMDVSGFAGSDGAFSTSLQYIDGQARLVVAGTVVKESLYQAALIRIFPQ